MMTACMRRLSLLNLVMSPSAAICSISAASLRTLAKSAGRRCGAASAVAAPSRIATATICCSQAVASSGATIAPTLGWNLTQPSASRRRSASRTGIALTPSSRASASMFSRAFGPNAPE